jgi:ABC-2 type transport system permease protein
VVAQILRLKLNLLANSFRRTPWQIVGVLIALSYGLGTAVLVAAALAALRLFSVEVARGAVVDFGALVIIIFVVLPLSLGLEDILDPRRFSLFGISNSRLATGIAIASVIGVPAIVITIIAAGQIVTWSRGPLPVALAVVGAALIIATCILSARIATSLATFIFSSRRSRDITSILGIVVLISLFPVFTAAASVNWAKHAQQVLSGVADFVGWTPLGAAWAAPADAAAGDSGAAWAKLLIAVLWLAVLWVIWRFILARILVTPHREAKVKRYAGLGWFGLMPPTPAGAIAARSMSYWIRDARYVMSLVVIPLIPLVMVVALRIVGAPLSALALLPVPIMSLFLAWSVHNDVSFDNTAIWLHLASSTSGRADRLGRLTPALLVGVPLIVFGSILSAWANGSWQVLPSLIGVSGCILLCGLGLSSITSVRFPYPTVRPGDSPFSHPHAGGSAAGAIQALSFVGILALTVPSIVAAILGLLFGPEWSLLSLLLGLGIGLGAFAGGVMLGSRIFDKRGPQLLAFSLRN